MNEAFRYQIEKLLREARREIEDRRCRCGNKKRKAVAVYGYGDMFMPSEIVLYCPQCMHNEVFAQFPLEQADALARKMKELGFVSAPDSLADKLIIKPPAGKKIKEPKNKPKTLLDNV